jgi:cell wall-associated NlpC family hydrolase
MNLIRNILLIILILQFLIFLYVKLIYENASSFSHFTEKTNKKENIALNDLVQESIDEIMIGSRKLPQSQEYTLWDEAMITKLNEKIQEFNNEMRNIVTKNASMNPPTVKKQVSVIKKITVKKVIIKKKITAKISMTKKIEKYAKKKLGKKYVWGAVGPKSFDCSGFTKNVFQCTTGINIPRVSRDQAKIGKYVKYKELQRGDMVFFDTEKKYSGKVNHVGIYLNNGNFIHASSAKKKVIITSFKKKPFYKKRFLWGRRVVKNPS